MQNCRNCEFKLREGANFCPKCGQNVAGVIATEPAPLDTIHDGEGPRGYLPKALNKNQMIAAVFTVLAIIVLMVIAAISSSGSGHGNSGGGSSGTLSGDLYVDEFYCSIGTTTASAIISSTVSETVYAFVTVGLYGSDGTLQATNTEYQYVEPGGQSLVNIPLGGTYIVGDCRVINVGY